MSDAAVEVDVKHLKRLEKAVNNLIRHVKSETDEMLNSKDLFIQYLAYNRLIALMAIFTPAMDLSKTSFRLGFDASHKQFNTKEKDNKGWNNGTLEGNPFFVNEGDDDDDEECSHSHGGNGISINASDLPPEARDMLADIMFKAMKSKK